MKKPIHIVVHCQAELERKLKRRSDKKRNSENKEQSLSETSEGLAVF